MIRGHFVTYSPLDFAIFGQGRGATTNAYSTYAEEELQRAWPNMAKPFGRFLIRPNPSLLVVDVPNVQSPPLASALAELGYRRGENRLRNDL